MAKRKAVKHSSTHKKTVHHEKKMEAPAEPIADVQQVEQPVIDQKVVSTDRDSIYADEAPKETVVKVEPTVNVKSEGVFKKVIAIVCGIIILLWIVIMLSSLQHNTVTSSVGHEVITYEYQNARLNLAEYTNITNLRYTEKVSLIGYLRLETVQVDKTTKMRTRYIVDDYGNRIVLTLGYGLNKYEPLFIENYTTDYTFTVTGTYRYASNGQRNMFLIDVDTITSKEHPQVLTAVNTTVYENVTTGKGYSLNLTKGWNRLTGK